MQEWMPNFSIFLYLKVFKCLKKKKKIIMNYQYIYFSGKRGFINQNHKYELSHHILDKLITIKK